MEVFNKALGEKISSGEINVRTPCALAATILFSGFESPLTLTNPLTSNVFVGDVVLIPTWALAKLHKASADKKKVFVFMVLFKYVKIFH
ncbi:hypothetical protein DRF65_02850 [Chryseobacterium pennae]|uniref:Uncharacterized protein n=1 Tax=Chryseobacterium pennae TaxID=2258962 RepID=A0A3D9CCP2_9FLAO|nr:hypothetical protein DRF65_02850 [Chryseobacterium pennae]